MNELARLAQSGAVDAIAAAFRAGADLNARDANGWVPLHHAVHAQQPEAVLVLLKLGADPNAHEQFGGTPLHWASEVGDAQSAAHLLRGGVDVDARDVQGRTALHDAVFKQHWEVVELLARADADWLVEDVGAVPSVFHLVFGGRDADIRERVELILESTAPSSAQAARALRRLKAERAEGAG